MEEVGSGEKLTKPRPDPREKVVDGEFEEGRVVSK